MVHVVISVSAIVTEISFSLFVTFLATFVIGRGSLSNEEVKLLMKLKRVHYVTCNGKRRPIFQDGSVNGEKIFRNILQSTVGTDLFIDNLNKSSLNLLKSSTEFRTTGTKLIIINLHVKLWHHWLIL